jgi:hypothetical protein
MTSPHFCYPYYPFQGREATFGCQFDLPENRRIRAQ